jgi:hypothetical protein
MATLGGEGSRPVIVLMNNASPVTSQRGGIQTLSSEIVHNLIMWWKAGLTLERTFCHTKRSVQRERQAELTCLCHIGTITQPVAFGFSPAHRSIGPPRILAAIQGLLVSIYSTGPQALRARILDLHGTLLFDEVEGYLEMLAGKDGAESWRFRIELPDKKLPLPSGVACVLVLENGRRGKCYVLRAPPDFSTMLRGAGDLK